MLACTAVEAPKGKVPKLINVDQEGRGGWITIHLMEEDLDVNGELVSVSEDDILVLTFGELYTYQLKNIDRARLVIYNTETAKFGIWTSLLTLFTVTNGYIAFITAPISFATGAAVTGTESKRKNYLDYPEEEWGDLRKFARFPQGMPPNLQAWELR